jgi:hypothetical protein
MRSLCVRLLRHPALLPDDQVRFGTGWPSFWAGARHCMNGTALKFAPGLPEGVAAYELCSIWERNSAMEPKRTVPCGSFASIEPSE